MSHRSFDSAKEALVAAWKLLLSLRKETWELRDYPVVIREQRRMEAEHTAPRFIQHRYLARVVKWFGLVGMGNTPDEAIHALTTNFEANRAARLLDGKRLPRPGKLLPIEFAPRQGIVGREELADDFVRRVLGLEWAWISDDSRLGDFHTSDDNAALVSRIKEVYGIDVSDIESGNLAEILQRIASAGS